MTRLITITSGKGGVGKTHLSVNLALELAGRGNRTCVFDADLGLANINVLLAIYPERNLRDVLLGSKTLEEIVVHHDSGIDILPGSSGVEEMADLAPEQVQKLVLSSQTLSVYDFLIFDTSAGISRDVIAFCMASPEVLLVLTPEPTSLTDGYALVKVLSRNGYAGRIAIVLNQCRSSQQAKVAYGKFHSAVKKFLELEVLLEGVILEDSMVPHAIALQKPLMALYPKTAAAKGIKSLADSLIAKSTGHQAPLEMKTFWEQCIAFFKKPMKYGEKITVTPKTKTAVQTPIQETPIAEKERSDGSMVSMAAQSPAQNLSPASHAPTDESTTPGSPAPPAIMEKISEALNGIFKELTRIRQVLEKSAPAGGEVLQAAQKPEVISLDLDAFIKERRIEGKE